MNKIKIAKKILTITEIIREISPLVESDENMMKNLAAASLHMAFLSGRLAGHDVTDLESMLYKGLAKESS